MQNLLDLNECIKSNGGCHSDAMCVNTAGSFRCVCDEGFDGDGYTCKGKVEVFM